MLNTETNTRRMEKRVLASARIAKLGRRLSVDFEHGQWWVSNLETGAQWSVNDAEGTESQGVFLGFCFEQVSRGEED